MDDGIKKKLIYVAIIICVCGIIAVFAKLGFKNIGDGVYDTTEQIEVTLGVEAALIAAPEIKGPLDSFAKFVEERAADPEATPLDIINEAADLVFAQYNISEHGKTILRGLIEKARDYAVDKLGGVGGTSIEQKKAIFAQIAATVRKSTKADPVPVFVDSTPVVEDRDPVVVE